MSAERRPAIVADITFIETEYTAGQFAVEKIIDETPTYIRVRGRFRKSITHQDYNAPRTVERYGTRGEWTFPWATVDNIRWRISIFPGPPGGEELAPDPPTTEEQLQALERRVAQLEWVDEVVQAAAKGASS